MLSELGRFTAYGKTAVAGKTLPLAEWNPSFCGDIDMRIAEDGAWHYNGTPILRPAMVQVFAQLLRHENGRYFLVTPVEKVGITVDDVPFIAVEMTVTDKTLSFRTNVGDVVTADTGHPLRFVSDTKGFRPYVLVRDGLEARLSRELARTIADHVEVREIDGIARLGISSSDGFFIISPA